MCAGTLAKIALFLISLVILLLGLAFITAGSLLLGYPDYLGSLLEQLITDNSGGQIVADDLIDVYKINDISAGVLLGVGSALLILGILGFLSSCGRNFFVFLYSSILALLTLAELGAMIYLSTPVAIDNINTKFEGMMMSSLQKNFNAENITNGGNTYSNTTSYSWMILQNMNQCCGSAGVDDYSQFYWNRYIYDGSSVVESKVPPSCCQMVSQDGFSTIQNIQASDYSNLTSCLITGHQYTNLKGCASVILTSISQKIRIPTLILSGAAAIQLFCLMITMITVACGNKNNTRKTNVVI